MQTVAPLPALERTPVHSVHLTQLITASRKRSFLLIPAVTLALAALALWAFWPTSVLEIHAGQEERLVKAMLVTPGERITYTYLHSVQKKPVEEVLEIASNGHLVVRETTYEMTGAGLPSDVLDGDFTIDPTTGKWKIINMSRDIPEWHARVAFTAQQTLEVGGEKFRFDSLATPTSLLIIGVTNRPHIAALLDSGEAALAMLGTSAPQVTE